jgi:hypothetical protein
LCNLIQGFIFVTFFFSIIVDGFKLVFMRYLFLVVVLTVFSSLAFSQEVKGLESKMEKEQLIEGVSSALKTDSVVVVKRWKSKAIYALNGSQTSFRNWNSGGRTNIALLGFIHASANYKYKFLKWGK